jgi:[methyl-Co(III) methanol-specific corrinoid protein]:coenzyme M methyltransferase
MTGRDVVLACLRGEAAERPAVLCPGGMMSMAVTEVMDSARAPWPAAHSDASLMVALAAAMHEASGFDNVAAPFCMTVEAEAFGAQIGMGDRTSQPRVLAPVLPDDGGGALPQPDWRAGRAGVLLDALRALAGRCPDAAVIGNLVGPFSLLSMLADPLMALRWTRRRPELAAGHLEAITAHLERFAAEQVGAGAHAVCIADPTATGEILGGELFRRFALPYLNRLARSVRQAGAPAIVHICGDVAGLGAELLALEADAVSFDSMVDLRSIAARRPPWQVMGNVSAFLLERGPADRVGRRCRRLVQSGVRLLAPACGLVPTTPVAHLRAMRRAAGPDPASRCAGPAARL